MITGPYWEQSINRYRNRPFSKLYQGDMEGIETWVDSMKVERKDQIVGVLKIKPIVFPRGLDVGSDKKRKQSDSCVLKAVFPNAVVQNKLENESGLCIQHGCLWSAYWACIRNINDSSWGKSTEINQEDWTGRTSFAIHGI